VYTQVGEGYAAAGKALRDEKNRLFEKAGVSARNPFSKSDATQLKNFQKTFGYHSTADWDHRTRDEVSGAVHPKMKNWLLRVRGVKKGDRVVRDKTGVTLLPRLT
jgi:hypothetical protein